MNGKNKVINPTREVVRTKSALGKPRFNKGKSPLSRFRGIKKPKLF